MGNIGLDVRDSLPSVVLAQMNILRSGLMLSLAARKSLSLKTFQKTAEVLSALDLMEILVRAGLQTCPLFNGWKLFSGPLCPLCLQQVCMK